MASTSSDAAARDVDHHVDLFVIGGGSGGVRAARVAAQHGARVAIAEDRQWGGTCVVRGCVPKKLLVYGSAVSAMVEDARGFGWSFDGARVDWSALIGAIDAEVARLSAAYAANLDRHGVVRLDGRARICAPGVVEVSGAERRTRVRAAHVLIATGGVPRRPGIPGAERMLTSDDVFRLRALPRRLVIVGAGYIGVEMAHIFAGLGTEVTVIHRGELPLRGFDTDVRVACADNLRARGITVHGDCEPDRVDQLADGTMIVTVGHGAQTDAVVEEIVCDAVLAAVGRTPATAGLGLEVLGVPLAPNRGIVVDEWQQTRVPGLYAVGDVTGRYALTPLAIREGHAFADTVFGGRATPFVAELVPTAVFAQPAIAAVGLTESEARARAGSAGLGGPEIEVHQTSFRPLRNVVSGRAERGLIKVICEAGGGRVLGLHVVGEEAAEIVQAAAIAVTMGATKADLDRTIAIHPTFAEELVLLR